MIQVQQTPSTEETTMPLKNHSSSPKRTSLLSKLRFPTKSRRQSHETLPICEDASSSCSLDSARSASIDPLDVPRAAGGCLKYPTEAQSLAETYGESPVAMEDSDNSHHSVRFGNMEVLIFPLQLGDNPSVSVGPPIAMGKELSARMSLTVEQYEETRPPRRHKQELVVPKPIREDWLRDEGFSRGECRQMEEAILKIKKSRKASNSCSAVKNLFQVKLFASNSNSKRRTSVLR